MRHRRESFNTSQGILRSSAGLVPWVELISSGMMWPRAGSLAILSEVMVPPTPVWLSAATCCSGTVPSFCAMPQAMMPVAPPAARAGPGRAA